MYARAIATQQASPAAQLFDRVRGSIERGLIDEGLDDLFGLWEMLMSPSLLPQHR